MAKYLVECPDCHIMFDLEKNSVLEGYAYGRPEYSAKCPYCGAITEYQIDAELGGDIDADGTGKTEG